MSTKFSAALAATLLLCACGDTSPPPADTTQEAPRPDRIVPTDVPLYSEDSDAKVINVERIDDTVIVTMETINGLMSPVTYYRNLPSIDWQITADTIDDAGGSLSATKESQRLAIEFNPLPDGAGTTITLTYTKAANAAADTPSADSQPETAWPE